MKKSSLLLAVLFLVGGLSGNAWAARSGGAFNFCAPYGGDLLTLDPQRSPNTNDLMVTMNIHRSLYSWDPEKNRPKLELGEKVDVSADGLVYRIALEKEYKIPQRAKIDGG